MMTILKLSVIICLIICSFSCGNKEKIRDNIFRGIYEGANREQEIKRSRDPSLAPEESPPTYDQYKKDRQKMLQTYGTNDFFVIQTPHSAFSTILDASLVASSKNIH